MNANRFLLSSLLLVSPVAGQDPAVMSFGDYWYRGQAEVSRFALTESRYGQARKGDAVLVFVTEKFLLQPQVKDESGQRDRPGSVSVLKLNALRRFNTGVYDYSMMTSVFTPVQVDKHPRSLKLTASVQEWCGQVYQQLNLDETGYRLRGHSYFEAEGDEDLRLPKAWLENEVLTRIRIDPKSLPTGKVKMIPSVLDSRLRHRQMTVQDAQCELRPLKPKNPAKSVAAGLWSYEIRYPQMRRSLRIVFEKALPHRILSWREDLGGGRVTTATLTHHKRIAYWQKSDNRDEPLRKELGLPTGR